jgi:hypothetical protein
MMIRLPPRIDKSAVVSAALAEIDRVEAGVRARCLGRPAEIRGWVAREIADAVTAAPRLGAIRVFGGAVARSYRYPAQATHLLVAWGCGRIIAQAARVNARSRPRGSGAWVEWLPRDEALRLIDPELAERRLARRNEIALRPLRRRGLVVPAGQWRVEREWRLAPVALLERLGPGPGGQSQALATPWGAWVGAYGRASTIRLAEVPELLSRTTGVPASTWERWLVNPSAVDPAEVEAELALGALVRGL